MAVMRVGIAEKFIDSPLGMDQTGFLARIGPAEGKHDDLKVKCIVFDDRVTKLAIILCDLLGLEIKFSNEVKALVGKILEISSDNVILACTHTHSGPASMPLGGCGNVDSDWLEKLKPLIANCAKDAWGNLRESKLSYGTGECDISYNRVLQDYAKDYRDPQVGILKIRSNADKNGDTVFVNYGCHAVTLGAENHLYTRDYPFYMEEAIKNIMGGSTKVLFANGCCGDQNPVVRGTFEIAEMLGNRLANSAVSAMERLSEEDFVDASICVEGFDVDIPLNYKYDRQYFENLLKEYTSTYDEEKLKNPKGLALKRHYTFIQWALDMLDRMDGGVLDKNISVRFVIAKIGKLVIIPLPFEVFHSIGLRIKKHFGENNTIVMGYANGNYGYLPSIELYDRADYEAGNAFRYYGYPGPVVQEAEDIICNKLINESVKLSSLD